MYGGFRIVELSCARCIHVPTYSSNPIVLPCAVYRLFFNQLFLVFVNEGLYTCINNYHTCYTTVKSMVLSASYRVVKHSFI